MLKKGDVVVWIGNDQAIGRLECDETEDLHQTLAFNKIPQYDSLDKYYIRKARKDEVELLGSSDIYIF